MTDSISPKTFQLAAAALDDGDTAALRLLLAEYPLLPCAEGSADNSAGDTTLLYHTVAWPGGKPKAATHVEMLIAAGADPNQRAKVGGESMLHWAASNRHDADVVAALVRGGADIDALGGVIEGGTPLMNAVHFGFPLAAAKLDQLGASVHNLMVAAGLGRVELLEQWHQGDGQYADDAYRISPDGCAEAPLLVAPAERAGFLRGAFGAAVFCEQYLVADWLLAHGADVNAMPEGADNSCLHQAAYRGTLHMAMYLVSRGADLQLRSLEHNAPPFVYGFVHSHPLIMNYLIDCGSEVTPEEAAACGRLDKVAECLDGYDNKTALLKATVGLTTAVGKPIPEEVLAGRQAVARYILQRYPELASSAEAAG